jgi:C-terminal processing protease CtpA/Prc
MSPDSSVAYIKVKTFSATLAKSFIKKLLKKLITQNQSI